MPALLNGRAAAAQPTRSTRTRKPVTPAVKPKPAKPTTRAEEDLATKFASALQLQEPSSETTGSISSQSGPSRSASAKTRSKAAAVAPPDTHSRPKNAPSTQATTSDATNETPKEIQAPWLQVDVGKKAMATYNEASQTLAKLVQAGWKASTAPPRTAKPVKSNPKDNKASVEAVIATASSCQVALNCVRTANMSYSAIDIEKAAGSLVGKLLSMELYQLALACLRDMKVAFLALYSHADQTIGISDHDNKNTREFSITEHANDHCLPLPSSGAAIEPTLLSMFAMFQLNAIVALARVARKTDALSLDRVLCQDGNIMDWNPIYRRPGGLEPARMVSIYNSIARNLSTVDATAVSLLRVRGWAMKCLMVSNAVEEGTLWEQSTKCARSYVNSQEAAKSTETDIATAKEVCAFFDELVKAAEDLRSPSLLSGPGFILACDYWIRFAKYLKDLPSMDKISRLLQRPTGDGTIPSSSYSTFASLGASELRAILARAAMALQQTENSENSASSQETEQIDETISALPRCTVLIQQETTSQLQANENKSAPWRKLSRTIDDLSRACEKVLRAMSERDAKLPRMQKVRSLMEAIVHHGEQVLIAARKEKPAIAYTDATFGEILDGTLDGLFVLARTTFQTMSLTAAAIPAFNLVQHALHIAHIDDAALVALPTSTTKERSKYANTMRSISASYHNNGATLLNGGKETASVPFWKKAAEVGEQAVAIRDTFAEAGLEGESVKDIEAWTQLREKHIISRWDMAGFALWKTGERKPAYDAYVRSLTARPKALYARIAEETAVKCSRVVMNAEPKLMSTIEKITSIATFDLLLTDDASLRKALEDAGLPAEVVGVLLECQVAVLDPLLYKEEVGPVMRVVLKDLKDLYARGSDFPVRRARILLRCLEFAYSVDDVSMAPSPLVIMGLLNSKNMGKDAALTRFIPQYTVSLEMMLSLQAHRQQPTDASTSVVLLHAHKAIKVLREMLHPQAPAAAADGKGKASKKGATGKASKTVAPARRAAKAPVRSSRTKGAVAAKTPQNQTEDIESITDAVQTLSLGNGLNDEVTLDDGEQFYRKLSSMSHLLGLLGHVVPRIELLDLVCTLGARGLLPSGPDVFMQASVELAHEYVKLGRTGPAQGVLAYVSEFAEESQNSISDEVQVSFLLRFAELSAIVGDAEKGSIAYEKAMRISERIPPPDKTTSMLVRGRARIGYLERSALACTAYAAIQLAKDDLNESINGLLQSLRLWNRATDVLLRLTQGSQPPPAAPSVSPNPFRVTSEDPAPPISEVETPSKHSWDALIDGLHWRLADGLITTLFALGRIHFIRGSVKASDFFVQKASDLVATMNAPILLSRALAKEAEKELALGHFDAGHELLVQASYAWEQTPDIAGPDLADVHRLQGDHSMRTEQPEEAIKIYDTANQLLARFGTVFEGCEALLHAAWRQHGCEGGKALAAGPDTVMPALMASVLRQHIWLLRMEDGEEDIYNDLLAKFLALPPSVETKLEVNTLMGKLTLEEVEARLAADIYLSSLTESTLALPLGMSSGEGVSVPTSTAELFACLSNAEKFFWAGLELSSSRGEVHQFREAALSLMLIRAFQTSLGKGGKNGSVIAAALLDVSSSVTLRRELIECIDYKFRDPATTDDLVWPAVNTNGSQPPHEMPVARRALFTNESDNEDDDEPDSENSLQAYWQSVKARYRAETMDAAALAAPQADHLPEDWTVIHISVSEDKQTLYISRQRARSEPLIFCLPLNRQGKREGVDDEDEGFSYDKAVEEMEDIIRLNDDTAKSAKDLADKEARAGWWADRAKLDARIKALLENIEYCWLGAFKTILGEPSGTSPEQLTALRTKMNKIFKRNGIVASQKRKKSNIRVDDAILECFSTLSPKCRDEEIEDFIYFVLDLYQLHGAPVALAEVDIDQVAVDLRTILEEHAAKTTPQAARPNDHLFLVLDKYVQGLPWESISILRGRSVSRIPSIAFLIDRLEMVHHLRPATVRGETVDRTVVDPLKTFYVLNPSGDLTTTQATYESSFKDLEKVGWRGVTGRVPSEEEMICGLEKSDLMLYFGHGGAQQYIRSHKLRHLPRCAATMLWGCSSGAMKEMGDFDRVGTPNHYMLAGCPTLVANLWDVTDREIDRVAQSVLTKLRINKEHLSQREPGEAPDTQAISIVQAVAQSRDACKLKYLTGAAPVVYGIPFYL
ncbi:hypothetical protein FRB93_003969 [Tulasnella sp. JGI-2019a]|nr:hypothetical protein FRB93_003969 [Tulasnella sp. JGI-2019a]